MRIAQVGSRFKAFTRYEEKAIPKSVKAKWDPDEKCWLLTRRQVLELMQRDALERLGIIWDGSLTALRQEKDQLADLRQRSFDLANAAASSYPVRVPEGKALRPYQNAAVEFLDLHHGRVLMADEMGTGKTVQILAWINNHPELKRIVVVCKAIGKGHWERMTNAWIEGEKVVRVAYGNDSHDWIGLCTTAADRTFLIINYDILSRYAAELKQFYIPDVVVLDEAHYCFPSNTTVLTDIGPCSIESVVDAGTGTTVLSYNKETRQLEWQPILKRFRRQIGFSSEMCYNNTNTLVRIIHEYGQFTCTANHRIWTDSGYKEAGTISDNDCLLVLPQAISNQKTWEDYSQVLLQKLCSQRDELSTRDKAGYKSGMPPPNPTTGVRAMWNHIYTDYALWCKEQGAILWVQLCSKMANVTTWAKRYMSGSHKESPSCACWTKRPCTGSQDAGKQSYGKPCNHRKDAAETYWQNILSQRRKRHDNTPPENACNCAGLANGVRNRNRISKWTIQKFATLLQSRYRRPNQEGSNRGRWKDAQVAKVAVSRPPKNGGLERSRVVCIKVLERGDYDRLRQSSAEGQKVPVYNIEVANNNNYFANGTLVSNCKNHAAQRTKAALKVCTGVEAIICATGTPIYNRPLDIWKIIHLLDPLTFPDKITFLQDYFDYDTNGFGIDWRKATVKNADELNNLLKSTVMIRRLKRDIMSDLPPKVRTLMEVDSDSGQAAVRDAEAKLAAAVRERFPRRKITPKLLLQAMRASDQKDNMFHWMRLVGMAKAKPAADFIAETLEELDTGKVVAFVKHHDVSNYLLTQFPTALLLDGRTPQAKRDGILQEFAEDPMRRLFIGSIDAAGDTISLTAASTVVFVEQHYSPFIMTQAEDRCHRFGQRDSVNVYTLVLNNSLDVIIGRELIRKQEQADAVLDGQEVPDDDTDVAVFSDEVPF